MDAAGIGAAVPDAIRTILATLWSDGRAAYVVGGSIRDLLLGRTPVDWDLATNALPEHVQALFPGAVYENRFGTVAVRAEDGQIVQVTTFRTDHDYADFRRPHRVEFGDTIEADLARRDFTVNAIAWGAVGRGPAIQHRLSDAGDLDEGPWLVDPHHGIADAQAGILRAVGDPAVRFEEDALRMVRAVRFVATLGLAIDPSTFAAMRSKAGLVANLSGERIAAELDKLLMAPVPSLGLRVSHDAGLLDAISAELAAQPGVAQNKIPGEDLWDHTLRSVDAARADRPIIRLAALLHDIGKPATLADGHFIGHDVVGADLAARFLDRLRYPSAIRDRVVQLVRQHMFSYERSWSDAAVRRFIIKVGHDAIDPLLELRAADNLGSGLPAEAGDLAELRRRVAEQMADGAVMDRRDLAVDGDDLIGALGMSPGPALGRVIDDLLERVIADPSLNDRPTLLLLAQATQVEP